MRWPPLTSSILQPLLLFPFLAIGVIGAVFFSHLPGQTWIAVCFNIAMAVPAFYGLLQVTGMRRGLLVLLVLSAFAFAIESLGVATGIPYSGFSYGPNLGPKLFELVPLTLPFAWVPLVIGSRVVAVAWLGPKSKASAALAVLLMVAFDLLLDPGAVTLGYWRWDMPGEFYGIPEQNYLGWILSSVIGQIIFGRCLRGCGVIPWYATYPFLWGVFFWTLVALVSGRLALVMVGLLIALIWMHPHLQSRRAQSKYAPS